MKIIEVNDTLVGKVLKLVDVKGFENASNEGEALDADVLKEFMELKVVRVDGGTFAGVAASRMHEAKYDVVSDSYDIEFNLYDYEIKYFEVVA